MKRKTLIILGVLLAAFGLYAVLTGGLVVAVRDDFGGQRDIRLAHGLKSDVSLSPRTSMFDIPLVFHYYGTGKPFALRLQIRDESRQYRSIDITEVVVEYKDGEVVRMTDMWSRQLTPYTRHTHSSSLGGMTETEMFALSDKIEGLVLRHKDVKVTLKGQLVKASGERIAFEAADSFEARSGSDVTIYWLSLASR